MYQIFSFLITSSPFYIPYTFHESLHESSIYLSKMILGSFIAYQEIVLILFTYIFYGKKETFSHEFGSDVFIFYKIIQFCRDFSKKYFYR